MWVDNKEGVAITLNELKDIYGEQAYAYNNEVVVWGDRIYARKSYNLKFVN